MQYDVLFCKHAALKSDTKWSVINQTLYARCFMGAAKNVARCELCWAATHETKDCPQQLRCEPTWESWLQSIEESIQTISDLSNLQPRPHQLSEACRKFNNQGCSYPYCRHAHVCMLCGGPHPELQCTCPRRQDFKVEPTIRHTDKPY